MSRRCCCSAILSRLSKGRLMKSLIRASSSRRARWNARACSSLEPSTVAGSSTPSGRSWVDRARMDTAPARRCRVLPTAWFPERSWRASAWASGCSTWRAVEPELHGSQAPRPAKIPTESVLPCVWVMKCARRVRLVDRIWRAVRLAATLSILFVIAMDIVADSRCNRLSGGEVAASLSIPVPPAALDPCSSGCVPDCFCCSTLSMTAAAFSLESSGPAATVVALADLNFSPGVHPLPYRPPLASL